MFQGLHSGPLVGRPGSAETAEPLPPHVTPNPLSSFPVPCVHAGLPKPTNITFSSINMENILQWSPPEGLQGAEVTDTVRYFMAGGDGWEAAQRGHGLTDVSEPHQPLQSKP
uniref:Interleukin 20 receptor subunit alpha n=1 Tax=Equus asinus TaxID=9793 RepID=A0A9L0JWQ2_EQUAS